MSRGCDSISSRKFASAGTTTRTQNAAVKSACSAQRFLSMQSPSQRLQSLTPSRLTLDGSDFLSRGGEPMEKCGYCSEIACSAPGSFCSTVVNLTMRAVDLTNGVPRRGYGAVADRSLRLHDLRCKSRSWCAHLIIAVTKPS